MSDKDQKKDSRKEETLSSFKDLLGKFGGDADGADAEDAPADTPPAEEDAADGEEEDALLSGPAYLVMRAQGDGFGPMTHGPRVYGDEHSEEMELLRSFRVRTVFPPQVLAELETLPTDPKPPDFENDPHREDLRGRRIFTIDGDDARDFDDAIAIARRPDGGYSMSVHIADVSHYVRPGTALNAEAMARATSVYVADQVIPMLPEKLSNHLCSLNPDRDRLAFSVFIEYDARGARTDYRVTKSVIRSMRRCTYRVVQELLDGVTNAEVERIADLKPDLELFAEWTKLQQAARDRRGSMRMQSRELKFKFDGNGDVSGVYLASSYFSQTLIEETALAANQAVGDFFRRNGLPTIYRIHPEKDPEELEKVTETLEKYGIRVPKKDRLTGRDIGEMIRFARRQRNADSLIARIMGLIERAAYEVRGADDTAEHFGLAMEHYLHFTSPIRRYPDLVVHRMLFDLMVHGEEGRRTMTSVEAVGDLLDVAAHSSLQADVASMVEQAVSDLKICQYMEPKIGGRFRATVVRVSKAGMNILLADEHVTGFLPSKAIGSMVTQEGPVLRIRGSQGMRVFHEGDTVEIVVTAVDFVRLTVMFDLAPRTKRSS